MAKERAGEPDRSAADVLGECTQFLEGQLLESFRDNRESAPDWVWVSVLAHASKELLASCAAEGGTPAARRIDACGTAPSPSCPRYSSTTPNAPGSRCRSSSTTSSFRSSCNWAPDPSPRRRSCVWCSLACRSARGPAPDHPAPTTEKRA